MTLTALAHFENVSNLNFYIHNCEHNFCFHALCFNDLHFNDVR